MLYKLSQGQKNIVDSLLAIFGSIFGIDGSGLAVTLAHAPSYVMLFGAVIGAIVGYFVSDAITYIDTGKAPPVASQAINLYEKAKPAFYRRDRKTASGPAGCCTGFARIDLEIAKVSGNSSSSSTSCRNDSEK